MGEFGFGQSVRNCPKIKEKMLFYETYFEKSNMNLKPFIWSDDKMRPKFGPKKWVSFILGKVYENYLKIKEKYYFTKPTSKRVIFIK